MNGTKPDSQTAAGVLGDLPGMQGARVQRLLSDGPSNASFQVELPEGAGVLRLDKPGAASLGLDRSNEKLVSQYIAEAGLAPPYLYFEPEDGVSLRRFLAGRCWTNADLLSQENLGRLAALLRKLHRLEPVGAPYQPVAAARRYAAQLDSTLSREILSRLELLAEKIHAGSPGLALCHNDLVCQNIIESERLMLIDWEYAGVGDPFFDLAVVVQHHGLNQKRARGFLELYLERTPSSADIEHLDLQSRFYACLLKLWEQIYPI